MLAPSDIMRKIGFLHALLAPLFAVALSVSAQQHRAVHLGHPATRFAPPLTRPEQLRTLLTADKWKADVASILQQAGWTGNLEDLRRAAATAPISEVSLPNGTRMPFMSSRENGRPIALMDVLWAGDEPISAYAFEFVSTGRHYRCITPKPCSNFFVVDLGPAISSLALDCGAPDQVVVGQRFDLCLTLTNRGNTPESTTTVIVKIPDGLLLANPGDAATNSQGSLFWTIPDLEPGTARQVCATFTARRPDKLDWAASALSSSGGAAKSHCVTRINGLPAILLETRDLDDPIEIGKEVVYEIKVTNQGTAPGTNLKLVCSLPDSEEFVSATGSTTASALDKTVTMAALPSLEPKAQALWKVTVKALRVDDARFKAFISTDEIQPPIEKDESTHLY